MPTFGINSAGERQSPSLLAYYLPTSPAKLLEMGERPVLVSACQEGLEPTIRTPQLSSYSCSSAHCLYKTTQCSPLLSFSDVWGSHVAKGRYRNWPWKRILWKAAFQGYLWYRKSYITVQRIKIPFNSMGVEHVIGQLGPCFPFSGWWDKRNLLSSTSFSLSQEIESIFSTFENDF